jgi:hypothetical protein
MKGKLMVLKAILGLVIGGGIGFTVGWFAKSAGAGG